MRMLLPAIPMTNSFFQLCCSVLCFVPPHMVNIFDFMGIGTATSRLKICTSCFLPSLELLCTDVRGEEL